MGRIRRKVQKDQADEFIRWLTRKMVEANTFVNVAVKPHKDTNYVWVIVG